MTEINNQMETKILPRELPFNQFEKIGMSKEIVLNLPKEDLKNLLSGNKTDILSLELDKKIVDTTIDAKLSLVRNNDNLVSLNVHPYRKEIDNKLNLNDSELAKLKKGEIIVIDRLAKNGKNKKHLVQLDQSINELVKVVKDSIRVPEKVNNIKLSNEQKERIASGKEVSIKEADGTTSVKLDLNNNAGIRIDSPLGYERNNKLDLGTKNDLKY